MDILITQRLGFVLRKSQTSRSKTQRQGKNHLLRRGLDQGEGSRTWGLIKPPLLNSPNINDTVITLRIAVFPNPNHGPGCS